MNPMCRKKWWSIVLASLLAAPCFAESPPQITQTASTVTLHNERVRLEFDLTLGT